jgi:hypothetical protein
METKSPTGIIAGRLQAGAITAGRLEFKFNPDCMTPEALAQWGQLGRRLVLMGEFDKKHPLLHKLRGWPVFRSVYASRMRNYVMSLEP